MAEYASKGVAGTGLGLGIAGTVALANQLFQGGGLQFFGGGPAAPMMQKEILDLTAENTLLKANQFTTMQVCPINVENARQSEQIRCLEGQILTLQNLLGQVVQPMVPYNRVVPQPVTVSQTTQQTGGQ